MSEDEKPIIEIGRIELSDQKILVFYKDGKAMMSYAGDSWHSSVHFDQGDLTMIKDWLVENNHTWGSHGD